MDRIWAQIKNGFVVNTIVLDNLADESAFLVGFDYLIEITNSSPQPSIGWQYDGTNFSP